MLSLSKQELMEEKRVFGVAAKKTMSKKDGLDSSSPWEACNDSWELKAVGDDDDVWDKFLPWDYGEILAREGVSPGVITKKQAYLLLFGSPFLLDQGKLGGGEKCCMLSARELSIAWKDTPYFWRWTTLPESRFSEVAELQCVCWLEIRGKIATTMLSDKTNYSAYLVFKAKAECFGLEFAAESVVKFVDSEEREVSAVHLVSPRGTDGGARYYIGHAERQVPQENAQLSFERRDGWMEIKLGEFYNDCGNDNDGEVEAALMETKAQNWKGGLFVEGIEFRPKGMQV
ncbi:F-box protein PP2-B10 isoform X2 [Daucus carota subsp. sativus]|uniref:F-box protein PP2-B10 isoform X2 n=1 Tax=Daucus carota subsp. sativus TaxID=79200 RepID=UPI0030829F57